MAKRFTDTNKWERPWFRKLPENYQRLWLYILDKCDIAGIWYVDFETAAYFLNTQLDYDTALGMFSKQISELDKGNKWLICDFVAFQYIRLSPNNPLHRAVIELLEKNNSGPTKGLIRAYVGPQDKDKVMVEVKDKESLKTLATEIPKTPKSETDIQKIVKVWKLLNSIPIEGPESAGWDKVHFPRHAKAAKSLLDLFGDWERSSEAMEYVYMHLTSRKLSCTIETIVKHSDLYREYLAGRKF